MNIFLSSGLITAIFTFLLGIFVLLKGRWRINLYKIFALYSFNIALWSFSVWQHSPSLDKKTVLFWNKILHVGSVFIPVLFVHFIFIYLKRLPKERWKISLIYLIGILFVILNLSGSTLFTKDIGYTSQYSYNIPGPLYLLFFFFFIFCVVYGIYLLINKYKEVSFSQRNQIRYFLLGTIIGYAGGLDNFLITVNWKVPLLYPYGAYGIIIYVLIIAYAIIAHRLMDIEIFIKKTTLIVAGGIIPLVIFYFGIIFAQDYLKRIFHHNWWVIPTVIGSILLFLAVKVINYALTLKEKELKQYQETLHRLLGKLSEASLLKEAFVYIPYHITRITNIKYAALGFIEEDDLDTRYRIKGVSDLAGAGARRRLKNYVLASGNPLIRQLKDGKIVKYTESDDAARKEMTHLGADIIFPCISNYQLLGFLVLGKKPAGYAESDINMFSELSRQASVYFDKLINYENNLKMLDTFKEESLKEIDAKDNYTYWHTKRVASYALMTAKDKEVYALLRRIPTGLWGLKMAAELHDIGKKHIPDEILKKKTKLTDDEYRIMQTHPEKALEVIYKFSPYLKKDIILGIIQHHESYNGTGYPKNLKDGEIHIYGRIIKVVDVFDALTTNRPYRHPLSLEEAVKLLIEGKGKDFDPLIVEAFLRQLCGKRIKDMSQRDENGNYVPREVVITQDWIEKMLKRSNVQTLQR